MKRPFRFWKAIVWAAYDVGFAALAVVAVVIVGPRMVRRLVKDWPERPVEVVIGASMLVLVVAWLAVAMPRRLYYLFATVRMWQRQRERRWDRERRRMRASPRTPPAHRSA